MSAIAGRKLDYPACLMIYDPRLSRIMEALLSGSAKKADAEEQYSPNKLARELGLAKPSGRTGQRTAKYIESVKVLETVGPDILRRM